MWIVSLLLLLLLWLLGDFDVDVVEASCSSVSLDRFRFFLLLELLGAESLPVPCNNVSMRESGMAVFALSVSPAFGRP